MHRHFGYPKAPAKSGAVVTIGMFDGVHIGHQAVIRKTMEHARNFCAPTAVITFDIHPIRYLCPDRAPDMITSLEHRLVMFEKLGVDQVHVIPFNEETAATTAHDFVNRVLVNGLDARGIVLGHDAHFGKDREGNYEYLSRVCDEFGFSVWREEPVMIGGQIVSSTAIRNAVGEGELDTASAMLARPVSVLGTVVTGKGLGRTLGFPTLNLDPHHELHPPRGVYVTRTRCGSTEWDSITNIGHRPTVDAKSARDILIESHILDYSGNLYGQIVEVSFLRKIRDEIKFDSIDMMQAQIAKDESFARQYFAD